MVSFIYGQLSSWGHVLREGYREPHARAYEHTSIRAYEAFLGSSGHLLPHDLCKGYVFKLLRLDLRVMAEPIFTSIEN